MNKATSDTVKKLLRDLYTCERVYVCTCVHACVRACGCACVRACVIACVRVRLYAAMRVCVHLGMRIYEYNIQYELFYFIRSSTCSLLSMRIKGEVQEHVTLSYLMTCGSQLHIHFLPRQHGVDHGSLLLDAKKGKCTVLRYNTTIFKALSL